MRIASLDTIGETYGADNYWKRVTPCRGWTSDSIFAYCLEGSSQRHPSYNIAACALWLCP